MQTSAATAKASFSELLARVLSLSDRDRLSLALLAAGALHLLILLGISFDVEERARASKTLEVTLAQFRSKRAPDEADFLAQHNQIGSGSSEQKRLPTTRETARFQANQSRALAAQQQATPPNHLTPTQVTPLADPSAMPSHTARVSTSSQPKQIHSISREARRQANSQPTEQSGGTPPASGLASSLLARSQEIASLQAQLERQIQEQARMPKVRRLYSASTRSSDEAAYLDSWRRKIETVGNLNYPAEAKRRGLYGNLMLMVALYPDGSIKEIEVRKSSGHKLLDDAAIRIVRLAAPFAPFPPEIRQKTDLLEITRTWKFERNNRLYSG